MTEPRRSTLLALTSALVLVVAGLAAEWIATGGALMVDPRFRLDAVVDLAAGWVLAGAGLVAWLGAPRSRVGPLLIASGAGWFLGTVVAPATWVGLSGLAWLAALLWQVHAGFLVHAIATWPSGRIVRPTQLLLVIGGYVTALFPQLWTDSPAYVLVGLLLGAGILADLAAIPAMRRPAYRTERDAGLLLAVAIAGIPAVARAFDDLGMRQLANPATLYAATVALVAVILVRALVARERRGAAADLAVRLREEELGSEPDVALELRMLDQAGGDTADPRLREAAARAKSLMERNQALRDALDRQVRELDASRRRLVEIGDEERRDLLERLRTGAGARLELLAGVVAQLAVPTTTLPRAAGHDATERAPEASPAVDHLDVALGQLSRVRADLEAVAAGLDPGRVAERGLEAALRDLAAASPVPVTLTLPSLVATTVRAPEPLPLTIATTLYFVASEALANVVRHARAGAAWLRIGADGGSWLLVVEDDGVGGADPRAGTGIRGLRERVEVLGGGLVVEGRPGGGTRLAASVPDPAGGSPG